MYFIVSFLLWGILFLTATISKTFTTTGSDAELACFVFQVITAVIFVIFFCVSVFYNMTWFREAKRIGNNIERLKKEVVLREAIHKELSEYYKKYLAEEYPQLERDVFLKIAESQPKELVSLLQTYPELKTSVVLKDMITQTTELVEKIYHKKQKTEEQIECLENIKCDPWLILKIR